MPLIVGIVLVLVLVLEATVLETSLVRSRSFCRSYSITPFLSLSQSSNDGNGDYYECVDRPNQECQKIFKAQLSMEHDVARAKVCIVMLPGVFIFSVRCLLA